LTPEIRPIAENDWPAVWDVIHDVIKAEETFPYDPAMPESVARDMWIERPPGLTVVAADGAEILGTAKMGTNRPGPGSHVATASFMVAASARGRGVGTALCRHAVAWARQRGYAGMQFNAVVETNTRAVALWRSLGFEVIGTVPDAFDSAAHGRVGLHVMWRRLTPP
jgi:L-amino acid N-acyltransferase YncA